MHPDDLAKEADRLTGDRTLNHALDTMRAEALESLLTINPTNAAEIMQAQARAAAVDEFRSLLKRYVLNWQEPDTGPSPYV